METSTTTTSAEKARLVREYEAHTTGSERLRKHWTGRLYWTDGIQYLAETCGAFWLVDLVASHQPAIQRALDKRGARDFQVWRMGRAAGSGWAVDAWDDTPGGRYSSRLVMQEIPLSDFPPELDGFEFYVEGGTMLLKGER